MTPTEWQAAGASFLYRKQYEIFYREAGEGEILLLLHGFPTASWDWWKIWDALAGEYQLLAPDFIGFGFSEKPRGYNYSIHDQADLVEELLRLKGHRRFHILAHDYGDTVAQELLARHNARARQDDASLSLQSLVFLNGGLFPETHRPRPIQKALLSPIGILLTPFLSRKKLRATFHEIFGPDTPPTEAEIDAFYSLIQYKGGRRVFHRLIRYMRDRVRHRERWVTALQEAEIPIRLIVGAEDPISGRHMVERYAELIPGSDRVLLEGIGHYPQTEDPGRVLEKYREFRAVLGA